MLIHSIKANQDCSKIRKELNLCRSNLLGKFVDPTFCQAPASELIDCFQKV